MVPVPPRVSTALIFLQRHILAVSLLSRSLQSSLGAASGTGIMENTTKLLSLAQLNK